MNEKDKEAFEKWIKNSWVGIEPKDYPNLLSREAWQAACLFKQKEIDDAKNDYAGLQMMYVDKCRIVEALQAQNAKLREWFNVCSDEVNFAFDEIVKEVEFFKQKNLYYRVYYESNT